MAVEYQKYSEQGRAWIVAGKEAGETNPFPSQIKIQGESLVLRDTGTGEFWFIVKNGNSPHRD